MNDVLECKGIVKKYNNKEVLKGIDLQIEKGKIYGLIGRNGAGKTTLISVLTGQSNATKGEVTLNGDKVWENERALEKICFSRELKAVSGFGNNNLKIKDYFRIASVFYPEWDKDMAEKLVDLFELDAKQKICKLSKGMMSMVTIIIALASKSEYTFLDEPVAGLDVVARNQFYRLLLEEYEKTERTFVISTHIIEEAADLFEEVIIIDRGKLLLKENTVELLDRSRHISGKSEYVDEIINKAEFHKDEIMGRSKGSTVVLSAGEIIKTNADITVQPVNLQQLFTALCDN